MTMTVRPAWWQWPTIASLDAPLVCLAWQAFVAAHAHVPLAAARMFVLGASVWLAYVADRWIEAWRLHSPAVRTHRHRFYQKQRWTVLGAWVVVLTADVAVSVAALDRAALTRGLILLGPVLAYLLSHQLVHRHRAWRAPKEIVIALLLTAGVGILIPARPSPGLIEALAAFAGLSFINCALISRWERDVDLAHGQTSLALQSRRGAALIGALPWLAAGAGVVLAPFAPPAARAAIGCAAASAILLGVVDRLEHRIGRAGARVLADAAMLTPFVLLLWR